MLRTKRVFLIHNCVSRLPKNAAAAGEYVSGTFLSARSLYMSRYTYFRIKVPTEPRGASQGKPVGGWPAAETEKSVGSESVENEDYDIDLITLTRKAKHKKVDKPSGVREARGSLHKHEKFIDDINVDLRHALSEPPLSGARNLDAKDGRTQDNQAGRIREFSTSSCFGALKEASLKAKEKNIDDNNLNIRQHDRKLDGDHTPDVRVFDKKLMGSHDEAGRHKIREHDEKLSGTGKYKDKGTYQKIFGRMGGDAGAELKQAERIDKLEAMVKLLEERLDFSKPEIAQAESKEVAKAEVAARPSIVSAGTSQKAEKLLSSLENIQILEDLLDDIKNTKRLEKEAKFRQIRAYEWSRNKILRPHQFMLFPVLNNSHELDGYFTSARRGQTRELFPGYSRRRGRWGRLIKRVFAAVGISFLGLVVVDVFHPELLQTDEPFKTHKLSQGEKYIAK